MYCWAERKYFGRILENCRLSGDGDYSGGYKCSLPETIEGINLFASILPQKNCCSEIWADWIKKQKRGGISWVFDKSCSIKISGRRFCFFSETPLSLSAYIYIYTRYSYLLFRVSFFCLKKRRCRVYIRVHTLKIFVITNRNSWSQNWDFSERIHLLSSLIWSKFRDSTPPPPKGLLCCIFSSFGLHFTGHGKKAEILKLEKWKLHYF